MATSKSTNRNTRHTVHHTRRYTRIRVSATKLFLAFITLLVMVVGTLNVGKVGVQILGTQFRMLHYYNSISDCESQRNYYQELAYSSQGSARRNMQAQADDFDAKIDVYSEKRTNLMESNDPIIAFAAKDQFDFLMLLLGISCFGVIALVWCFVHHHFLGVIETEFKIFNLVVSRLFMMLALSFYALHYVCYRVAIIFGVRPKTRKHVKRRTNKIVPFRKKRVG